MRLTIAISMFLTACSTAYGEETLNLELQCDGVLSVHSSAQEILSLFGANTTNEEPFSTRLSIKDNFLGSKGPRLKVTDTRIYLPEKAEMPEAEWSGTLEVFEIDRLTGALDMKVIVAKPAKDTVEGVPVTARIDAKCEKLDPNKKKF